LPKTFVIRSDSVACLLKTAIDQHLSADFKDNHDLLYRKLPQSGDPFFARLSYRMCGPVKRRSLYCIIFLFCLELSLSLSICSSSRSYETSSLVVNRTVAEAASQDSGRQFRLSAQDTLTATAATSTPNGQKSLPPPPPPPPPPLLGWRAYFNQRQERTVRACRGVRLLRSE
jgi:hypothetical protein